MKMNILIHKSSSGIIMMSLLCLISLFTVSCDDMRPSMIPAAGPVPDPPVRTHIVDTIDYIKALHNKREEFRTVLAKESNTEVISFPDRLVIPRLDIAKPLDSIDQWIYDVNTTEIIKALNEDLEKLQQDIAAVRNQAPGTVGPSGESPVVADPTPPPPVVADPTPPPPVVADPTPPPPPPEPPPPPPPPPPEPPPPVLSVGDKVIVRNTLDDGISIRDDAGRRIGGMFDGETGVVISDIREDRGLIWVEIEWDAPVKNPDSGCGEGQQVCIGWSAVFVQDGTRIIHKRE